MNNNETITPEEIANIRTSAGFPATPSTNTSTNGGVSLSDMLKSSADKYDTARAPVTPTPFSSGNGQDNIFADNPEAAMARKDTGVNVGDVYNNIKSTLGNTGENISEDLNSNREMAGNISENDNGSINPIKAIGASALSGAKSTVDVLGETAKGAGGVISDLISPFIPQNVKNAYGSETTKMLSDIKDAWDAPANTPEEQAGKDKVHAFIDNLTKIAKDNPETSKTIGNALAMVLAPSAIEGGMGTIKKIGDVVGGGASSAMDISTIGEDTGLVKEGNQMTPENSLKASWNDIQPKSTAGTRLAYAKAGNVNEQGLFNGGEMTPSPADKRLLDIQAQLYDNGTLKENMSPNEKQAVVKQEAKQFNSDQTNLLKDNDKAVRLTGTDVNGKSIGLFDKLDSVAKESSLPFARDTSLKNVYDSVLDVYKSKLDTGVNAGTTKGATTLSKASDALTQFDKEMEKFGAYKKSVTGEITDTAQIRQNAIRDVHETVRDFIANELPKNSPWKSIRNKESMLYDISDRLAQRIVEGMGSGKIVQAVKDNPIVKTVIETTGLGTALKILK